MSDFLGNLAMKSLGLAPTVQPRPLSPFEALPAEGALAARAKRAADRPAEPLELETESDARLSPAAPRPVQPAAFTSAATEKARDEGEPYAVGARHAPRAPLLAPARASQPTIVTPTPQPSLESVSEGTKQSPLTGLRPTPSPLVGALNAVPLPAPPPPLPAPPLPARPVAAPADEDEAEPPHRRRTVTPLVEQIKASSAPNRAAEAEGPAERAEPAPTISVTIGRVEVRAALTPHPAPERRVERRGAPSLDDYLRMRSGGKP